MFSLLRISALITASLLPQILCASDQSAIEARIMEAGHNDFAERTHEIVISNCQMTTFVYEDWGPHPRVLWSSFQLDLRDLKFRAPNENGSMSVWIPSMGGRKGASMLLFEMREGRSARHEIALRRKQKPPYTQSPREGVDQFVFKDSSSFFILHEGLDSDEKAENFMRLLHQYRLDYCFVGG